MLDFVEDEEACEESHKCYGKHEQDFAQDVFLAFDTGGRRFSVIFV